MTSPLIDRLTQDLGWPHLASLEDLSAFTTRAGMHCVFIPGDPVKNLETNDAAVILPEIVQAFGGAFDCAVVADPIERQARELYDTWPTPSLIFVAEGVVLGTIPKVRDWEDYVTRTRLILSGNTTAAA